MTRPAIGRQPGVLRILTANLDKNRSGDAAYLDHLRTFLGTGILCLQEDGHGIGSTRIEAVGDVEVTPRRRWVIGTVGVHRGVARAATHLDGRRVLIDSVHGLHVRTQGRTAAGRYLDELARRVTARARPRRVTAGDFNAGVHTVADRLGGRGIGQGIIGFVVSPGLRVVTTVVDRRGIPAWTDHPAILIEVELAPKARHRKAKR